MNIRFAEIRDITDMDTIYNQAILAGKTTGDLAPLSNEQRSNWFYEHDNERYPIYVAILESKVCGWCSISTYRRGRGALNETAELSYYVSYNHQRQGIGSALINHAIKDCERTGIKNLFAILLETNLKSINILEKSGFKKWGRLPDVANFNGEKISQLIYGINL